MKHTCYYLIALGFIISIQAVKAQTPSTPETINDVKQAWVRLFDDKACKDRVLVVKGSANVPDMNKATTEDGKKGFGDKTSSVRFQIPKGWKLVLFDDNKFRDSGYELKGTGKVVEIADLGSFSDKTSSCRWEQDPQ